ncbi:leucyl aminopeptidase family protein [Candidatus Actinomarina]|nr:leucyl aminopeptidase family protein [Candidatus Actinomarina sp.]
MNIDILFFDENFKNKDQYIADEESFIEYIKTHQFEGKSKETLLMPPSLSSTGNQTILTGSGDYSQREIMDLGYSIGKKIKSNATIKILNFKGDEEILSLGILFSTYKFDTYKTKKEKEDIEITFSEHMDIKSNLLKKEAVFWVRDMINTPSLDKTPEFFIDKIKSLNSEIDINVHDEKWLEDNNFGAVLGVAKGSERKPYFLVGEYNKNAVTQIALIGKGVMFDSGGLSLKSPAGMDTMKTDMAGAATAWGVMSLISKHKVDIGLTVLTPIVENMPSGKAIRPGDVLTARNGKTIEVLNTDAEGRLIMADALAYASEKKPDLICDVATLTGAAYVALGIDIGAIFSNNKKIEDKFMESTKKSGEDFYPLPLHGDYKKLIDSDIADMKNTGGRFGGAITAALLLENFVEDLDWVHLDIAGPARSNNRKGATGFSVLTLFEFFSQLAKSHSES